MGYDWCQPNCNNATMAWKFSADKTFNYSKKYLFDSDIPLKIAPSTLPKPL